MKLLFLTTFNILPCQEHYFTKNIALDLTYQFRQSVGDTLKVCTIRITHPTKEELSECEKMGFNPAVYILGDIEEYKKRVEFFVNVFRNEQPDVIHSNMIEGYDIEAAKHLGIPIFNTIHIGGILCPRSGGNGFLRFDETICRQKIGKDCAHCMSMDLPFPKISYALHKISPRSIKKQIAKRLHRRIFYLSAFLRLVSEPENKQKFVQLAQYSNLIVANNHLAELCKLNGLSKNLHILPHGVKDRTFLPMPPLSQGEPIKFYFLGRMQSSKGLHIIFEALRDIDPTLYELHVIGDGSYMGRSGKKYEEYLTKLGRGLNVTFHGRIPNEDLETKVKDYHVMIHSAIFHEVYGLTIAESLSMGRPVLATRCGGAEMQIKDGYNGWLIAPNDVLAMKEAIMHIINNRDCIGNIARNCRNPMPITQYTKSLIELYHAEYEKNR